LALKVLSPGCVGARRSRQEAFQLTQVILPLCEFATRSLDDKVAAFDGGIKTGQDRVKSLMVLAGKERGLAAEQIVQQHRGHDFRFAGASVSGR
jgi:hypothetical protein